MALYSFKLSNPLPFALCRLLLCQNGAPVQLFRCLPNFMCNPVCYCSSPILQASPKQQLQVTTVKTSHQLDRTEAFDSVAVLLVCVCLFRLLSKLFTHSSSLICGHQRRTPKSSPKCIGRLGSRWRWKRGFRRRVCEARAYLIRKGKLA